MRVPLLALIVPSVMVLTLGCAEAPDTEIQVAREAYGEARSGEAQTYAGDSFARVEEAATALDREMQLQEEKFSLFRSYDTARKLADSLRIAANTAVEEARVEKQLVREETASLIVQARGLVAEAEKAFTNAPAGKGSFQDLAVLRADLAGAAMKLTEAEQRMSAGDFLTAREMARTAMVTIQSVETAIQQAEQLRGQPARPGRT